MKKIDIKGFVIVALLVGEIFSFGIPRWQVPDEVVHLKYISQAFQNEAIYTNIIDNMGIPLGVMETNPECQVNLEEMFDAMTKVPEYSVEEMMPQGVTLLAIKHLPASAGMFLGILLQLPAFWVIQLGELFSLCFYVAICACALKVCPFKKNILALIMLSPMMMQQAASISYDASVNALVFWVISYALYVRFEKERIELKELLFLLIPWLVITYIKLPYTLIILLGLMFPLKMFHVKLGEFELEERFIRKYRWIALGALLVIMAGGIYVLRDNRFVQVIIGLVSHPGRTLYLLKNTFLMTRQQILTSSVGNFGWLSAPVSYNFTLFFYLATLGIAVVGTDGSYRKIKRWDRVVIWAMFLSLLLLVAFSMVNHGIMVYYYGTELSTETYDIHEGLYVINHIGGIQGRYYMPFVPLVFLQVGGMNWVNKKFTQVVPLVLLVITYAVSAQVILERFWI